MLSHLGCQLNEGSLLGKEFSKGIDFSPKAYCCLTVWLVSRRRDKRSSCDTLSSLVLARGVVPLRDLCHLPKAREPDEAWSS